LQTALYCHDCYGYYFALTERSLARRKRTSDDRVQQRGQTAERKTPKNKNFCVYEVELKPDSFQLFSAGGAFLPVTVLLKTHDTRTMVT